MAKKIQGWVKFALLKEGYGSKDSLIAFYNELKEKYDQGTEVLVSPLIVSNPRKYKNKVFELLKTYKDKNLSENELIALQMEIEKQSMSFDEESIFKMCMPILRIMIKENDVNAKDYIKAYFEGSDENVKKFVYDVLSEFNTYTIESLIVHVICLIYHNNKKQKNEDYNDTSMVRVANLVDRLDDFFKTHVSILKNQRIKKENWKCIDTKHQYTIGYLLVQFLYERNVITFINSKKENQDEDTDTNIYISENPKFLTKKKGQYYISTKYYAAFNFDLALLPVKLNLPMISPPLKWEIRNAKKAKMYLTDITGGYLSSPSGEVVDRYQTLSSHNNEFFNISFGESHSKKDLNKLHETCELMNWLQKQPFQINSDWLNYIKKNEETLVELGYLYPKYLSKMNFQGAISILRDFYSEYNQIFKKSYSFDTLVSMLSKHVQYARSEQLFLSIAEAYDGWQFYLPAFLDFRGRIYRTGILHFHERDLARSLIIFGNIPPIHSNEMSIQVQKLVVRIATAFHYKSFNQMLEAKSFIETYFLKYSLVMNTNTYKKIPLALIKDVRENAKNPHQYLGNLIAISNKSQHKNYPIENKIPIVQDASASAFQIMSYFLLDMELGKNTNLINIISDETGTHYSEIHNDIIYSYQIYDEIIHDIYSEFILSGLTEHMKECLLAKTVNQNEELKEDLQKRNKKELSIREKEQIWKIVEPRLNRKLVKSIYMPLIYGKTNYSIIKDLQNVFYGALTFEMRKYLTDIFMNYWNLKFHGVNILMELIGNIGWIVAANQRSVVFKSYFYKTTQDYIKNKSTKLHFMDKKSKKKRQVTVQGIDSSELRNKTKTQTSTFVNFIHQFDANIAMLVISNMKNKEYPIYTVHDNFITTAECSREVPLIYNESFIKIGKPLTIINSFIYMNIIEHNMSPDGEYNMLIDEIKENDFDAIIPQPILMSYLLLTIPDGYSTDAKKKKNWENKIKKICDSYYQYIDIVCNLHQHVNKTPEMISEYWTFDENKMSPDEYMSKCREAKSDYDQKYENFEKGLKSNTNSVHH